MKILCATDLLPKRESALAPESLDLTTDAWYPVPLAKRGRA